MEQARIAILGGDRRELTVARRLKDAGHTVAVYGVDGPGAEDFGSYASAGEAVKGAQFVICPSPGIGPGNTLYAPTWDEPIVLDKELMESSDLRDGALVLGRLPESLRPVTEAAGYRVFQTKDAKHLSIANSPAVAEGLLAKLIELTDEVLRDYDTAVLGYGTSGTTIVDYLLAVGSRPTLIARSLSARARAKQRGARPHPYEDRVAALAASSLVINTVPDTEAVPVAAFPALAASGAIVADIASPPGGMDHDAAKEAGVAVHWLRGLGSRAPVTYSNQRYGYLAEIIASV